MKKGLSPLIAVVLLLAFTIAIGAIISGFLVGFSREQTASAEEKGESTIDCGSAAIKIRNVNIGSDLTVNVENIGTHDFTDIDLSIRNTSTSEIHNVESNANVLAGRLKSVTVTGWGATNDIYEVTVVTECPGISSTARNVSGTFKEVF